MVKKLFKHELVALSRTMIPVCAMVIILAVFGRILQLFEGDNAVYNIVSGFTFGTYFILCFASVIAPIIVGVQRFHKNLFTSEGYLSFTLPVSSTQHILVKLLAYVTVQTLSFVSLAISIAIVFRFEFVVELFKAAGYLIKMIPGISGVHTALYCVELLSLFFFTMCSEMLLFYVCIAIGQTRKKNRVAFSVGVYFLLTVIGQILSSVLSVATEYIDQEKMDAYIEAHTVGCIHGFICVSAIISALIAVACFFVVRYILNNKLNLE